MLELLMTAGLPNLEPAVLMKPANDFPAVHRRILPPQEYTFRVHLSMTGNASRGKNMCEFDTVDPDGELKP
jgi:hypothetical protein